MQPLSSTPPSSDYQSTSITSSKSSSTDGTPSPAIRTGETREGSVNIRSEVEGSEERLEEEASLSQNSQAETHEKAGKQGQPQRTSQGSHPRYSEPGARAIPASLPPGASSSSSTEHTGDASKPTGEASGAYRLRLEQWVESATDIPMACRQEVKARIEEYLDSPEKKAWTLDLSSLDLKIVPPLPPDLKKLCLGNNELSVLPEHLPAGLQKLAVFNNELSALPEHLPAGLQKLDVSANQLSALPEHLPAGLQILDVKENQLTSLPPSLLNVDSEVDLTGNPLSTAVLDRLRRITSAPDYLGPRIYFSMAAHETSPTLDSVRPLTDAILNWLSKESTPWAGFAGEEGATEFSLFLDKLAQSIVGREPAFRTTFQSWLREMAVQPALRAHVFAVARGATESCQDRVMLTANDMAKARLLFHVERGAHDQRLPELIDIARGMFRLEKLEAIARKKAESLKLVDEVEVYLAYQVKLREPLRLPLAVGEMAYFKVSGVEEHDLLAAEASVKELENREFRDFLLTWQPWLQALKRAGGSSEDAVRAHQFALWDAEYEQPLARLEEAIEAIDRQLHKGSASTTSGAGQTDLLEAERQRLTAQRNDLVSGARTLSDDIARRIASDGHARLPISSSLLGPVWGIDGGYMANSSDAAADTGSRTGST